MKQVELIAKRKPREKHFLQEDGTIVAKIYDTDVHYLKNGKYEDIDNTLIRVNNSLVNKSNDYKAEFNDDFQNSLLKMIKDNHYLNFKLRNFKFNSTKFQERMISKELKNVTYNSITDDIKIEYQTLANKVKETIILQNANYSEFSFEVNTDLKLIEENGEIICKDNNHKIIFRLEKPFMVDSNNQRNDTIYYSLDSFSDGYILTLLLDDEWLNSIERVFPVYVDPTITNENQNVNLYDTYIYPDDTGSNNGTKDILKVGAEKVNGNSRINRALIKFDLPEIGTGSEIIYAELNLIPYISPSNNKSPKTYYITAHRITQDWNESTANWNQMNDKYDKRVEAISDFERSYVSGSSIVYRIFGFRITELVKKWYKDTKNYGIMLKSTKENYIDDDFPAFYSKNNTVAGNSNPKPIFSVTYRNQNGLEYYLNYKSQKFEIGSTYVNTYNGNLVGIFNIGNTVCSQLPAEVSLIYNTNDVILKKSTFFGEGFKLNLEQTIKTITINNIDYLEYEDDDGTIHYFYKKSYQYPLQDIPDNLYCDEDGLGLEIEIQDNQYIMTDKEHNKKVFSKIGNEYHLTKICDSINNEINIQLDSNNRIIKVIDSNNKEISLIYNDSTIIIESPSESIVLDISENSINQIQTFKGNMVFKYNNKLISSIVDINKLKMEYEYYENSPYKIKKVIQYGLNNTLGRYITFEYGHGATTIVDNNNRKRTLLFNESGNLLSISTLGDDDDISEAYSLTNEYGMGYYGMDQNKITSNTIPMKYVKNYLKNTSFENDEDYFKYDYNETNNLVKSFSEESANLGNRSLKISTTDTNQSIYQLISVPKGNYYTFSCYLKNNIPVIISLSYSKEDGTNVYESQTVDISETFGRNDVTIYYDENAKTDLKIKLELCLSGVVYIDDIQLEKGKVVNSYNIIENSDFSDGFKDWEFKVFNIDDDTEVSDISKFFEIVKLNNDKNIALKVNMNPNYTTRFGKKYQIKGKKDELFTLSFWYKNEGVEGCLPHAGNNMSLFFYPSEGCIPEIQLNYDSDKWQFFSYRGRALEDFTSIYLDFSQYLNANTFYITNISFYKNVTSGEYEYDNNGNLVSIKSESDIESVFKFDDKNQLLSATTPVGRKFRFEYDNEISTRLINAISYDGISNTIDYDEKGNPIRTNIYRSRNKEIGNGKYRIRCKGTKKFIKAKYREIVVEENACSNTVWDIKKTNESFKFIHSIIPDFSLAYKNNVIVMTDDDSSNVFTLEQNENGSYYIKTSTEYLKADNDGISICPLEKDNPAFEFYFETIIDEFFENDAEYDINNNFVNKITKSSLGTISYDTDPVTGLIKSITDNNGNKVVYNYNDKNQLLSISRGNRTVEYSYNDNNLLYKVSQNNLDYKYTYDDFFNVSSVKIGDSINNYISNKYDYNTGNLIKTIFGNNQEITYEYDIFNRLVSANFVDDLFQYNYDNNGNIAKIISNDHILKNEFDMANRLINYTYDEFKINYTYDNDNNLVYQKYKLNENYNYIQNNIDDNDCISKILFDNNEINYEYDSLNRVSSILLPNNYVTKFTYVLNGKRTTDLIKSIENNGNIFNYKYDELENLSEVYYNNNITNKYYYDDLNQLVKEENYSLNQRIEYLYDNSGNILSKTIRNLIDNSIIKTDSYQYNDLSWNNLLTQYNDINIAYDEIGNPISIGNDINLTWTSGRNLKTYSNTSKNLNIDYKYNHEGIRTTKIVNDTKIDYFLEGNQIIYENRKNDLIYYLYDSSELIGLKYKNSYYYYVKNMQDDIIGILDSTGKQIVSYEYDSWGKLLSVKDENGNAITDNNNIGYINPFRYRSYYYDIETGLYYLNYRYYNPDWSRFINPDMLICSNQDVLSFNLFTYVSNNPIMYADPLGQGFLSNLVKKAKKLVKQAKKAITNFVNDVVTAVREKVSSLFSYNVNSSKDIYKSFTGNGIFNYEHATSSNYSEPVVGSSDSFIKYSSVQNQQIEFNTPYTNSKIEFGGAKFKASSGININNYTYSIISGLDGIFLYFGFEVKDSINENVDISDTHKFNVNSLPVLAIVVMATVHVPVPAAVTSAASTVAGAASGALNAIGSFAFV